MKEIDYKLIISDFDGTLADGESQVSEKNKKAIAEYIEAGGIFVISTGRLPQGIMPTVKKLGLRGLVCCCQGAVVLDIESGEAVFEERLSLRTTLAACRKMEDMGATVLAFDMWKYYANKDGEYLKLYEKNDGVCATVIRDKRLSEFIEENKFRAYKLLVIVDSCDSERVVTELKAADIPDAVIVKSHNFLVEAVNDKHSKGSALRLLAERYGVPIEKTIGIGDNCNDIPMIEAAGLGVAVNNSAPQLKAAADYVCKGTNNESAVAEVIERFGFLK